MSSTPQTHLTHKTVALQTHNLLKDAGAKITPPKEKPCGGISFLSICHNGITNQWEFLPCGTYQILQQNGEDPAPLKFNPRGIAGLIDRLHNPPKKKTIEHTKQHSS